MFAQLTSSMRVNLEFRLDVPELETERFSDRGTGRHWRHRETGRQGGRRLGETVETRETGRQGDRKTERVRRGG
jgi:hypothetical protein